MTVTDILETRLGVVGLGGYARDIQQAGRALGIFKKDLDDVASAELLLGVAAGAASIAIVNGLSKATLAAGQHTAVLTRTTSSFQQFGHSFPQAELVAWTNQVQDATGIARDQVASIAGLYAEYGLTADQTKKFTKATLEASVALKAQGTSAEQIAKFVGTAQEMIKQGDTKGLSTLARRIGLVVNEARAATDPMGALLDALNRKGGQQAELYKSTLPGAIDTFGNALTRLAQDVGANFEGPLTSFTKFGTSVVDFLDQNPKLVAFAAGLTAVALALKAVNTGLAIFQSLQAAGGVSGLLRGIGGRIGVGAASAGAAAGVSGGGMSAAETVARLVQPESFAATAAVGLGLGGGIRRRAQLSAEDLLMNRGKLTVDQIAAARAAGLIGGGGRLAGGGFEAVAGKAAGAAGAGLGGAEVAGAAGLGLGARALGLLKGPLGIGLALAGAGYGVEALSKGHEATAMGKFGTISAAALKGAGIGAGVGGTIGTFFGPGPGTFLGGLIGGTAGGIGGAISGAAGLEEKEVKRDNTDKMEDLTKSIQDLHAQMQSLNKNLDGLVGDREIRATIGDARILAAFARGIA